MFLEILTSPRDWSATLDIVNTTSPYGLTGAIFATDRSSIFPGRDAYNNNRGAIMEAQDHLRDAAGNIYVRCCNIARSCLTINMVDQC